MTCSKCRFWDDWTCISEKWTSGYGTECPIDGVLVEDDEGWGFETGPNFGCIHFESKE